MDLTSVLVIASFTALENDRERTAVFPFWPKRLDDCLATAVRFLLIGTLPHCLTILHHPEPEGSRSIMFNLVLPPLPGCIIVCCLYYLQYRDSKEGDPLYVKWQSEPSWSRCRQHHGTSTTVPKDRTSMPCLPPADGASYKDCMGSLYPP